MIDSRVRNGCGNENKVIDDMRESPAESSFKKSFFLGMHFHLSTTVHARVGGSELDSGHQKLDTMAQDPNAVILDAHMHNCHPSCTAARSSPTHQCGCWSMHANAPGLRLDAMQKECGAVSQ